MIGRSRHLREDRLYECYLSARAGEPLDPPAAEHLADCATCQAQFAELEGFLEIVRGEAEAECDAVFTPEHLVQQKDQILRRIEHLHRAARVISFPGGMTPPSAEAGANRFSPRWLAVAAAAGLFVGVAVGGLMVDRQAQARVARPMQVASGPASRVAPQPAVLVSSPVPVVDAIDDERFISELEMALSRTRPRELQAFDALTPHARDQRLLR